MVVLKKSILVHHVVKVRPLNFYHIDISPMTRHPSKANKLRDIYTIRNGAGNSTV